MFNLPNLLLIIISVLLFLLGYASLTDKFDNITMWFWSPKWRKKEITDKKGYKKHQGKFCIIAGIVFLLVPCSIHIVESTSINQEILYLWFIILTYMSVHYALEIRKYLK